MLGFLLLAFLLINTARSKSMVYDEVIYPAAGVLYWTTEDWGWNKEHPPLQKLLSSLFLINKEHALPPGLLSDEIDQWRLGYAYFFGGPTSAQTLLFLSRLPTILLTLLLAFFVFRWTSSLASPAAGLIALFAFALDPLVLGNGSLAMNDLFVTAFMFLAVMIWQKNILWLCGLLTGAAIASKFSGFLLWPILAALAFPRRQFKSLGVVIAISIVALFATYKFNFDLLLNSLEAGSQFHGGENAMGFLLKPISARSGWFYYPIATLIKTPLPLLLLWGFALYKVRRSFLLVPVILIWVAALISSNHFGLRYLLPATPFLAVTIGIALAPLLASKQRLGALILLGWLGVETLLTHPHHMAYFNEIIGGSRQGYKWLDGSNQDWGQDLPTLAKFLKKEGHPRLLLSYQGSGKPEAWGIRYQDVFSPALTSTVHENIIFPVDKSPEFIAVSAKILSVPAYDSAFAWLKKRKPKALLGYTLFVYDITGDTEAANHLGDIYRELGRFDFEKRQREMARLTYYTQ